MKNILYSAPSFKNPPQTIFAEVKTNVNDRVTFNYILLQENIHCSNVLTNFKSLHVLKKHFFMSLGLTWLTFWCVEDYHSHSTHYICWAQVTFFTSRLQMHTLRSNIMFTTEMKTLNCYNILYTIPKMWILL